MTHTVTFRPDLEEFVKQVPDVSVFLNQLVDEYLEKEAYDIPASREQEAIKQELLRRIDGPFEPVPENWVAQMMDNIRKDKEVA